MSVPQAHFPQGLLTKHALGLKSQLLFLDESTASWKLTNSTGVSKQEPEKAQQGRLP